MHISIVEYIYETLDTSYMKGLNIYETLDTSYMKG